jgi:hypothetical protein
MRASPNKNADEARLGRRVVMGREVLMRTRAPSLIWMCSLSAILAMPVGRADSLPAGLFVADTAEAVVHTVRNTGIHDLSYRIAEPFPATTYIAALQRYLKANGWSIPERDPLNPELPSSVTRDWAHWLDTGKPHPIEGMYIRDWQGIWLNEQQALVSYVLRYQRNKAVDPWSNLEVVAVYWPPEVLAKERQRAKERAPR